MFFAYQFPNGIHPEREITKGCAWCQFEALDALDVFDKIH
jgi:hypothetical protein